MPASAAATGRRSCLWPTVLLGLRRFITDKALPWFDERNRAIARRPLIREQASGETLDPDKPERLGRSEVHFDRAFERMLCC